MDNYFKHFKPVKGNDLEINFEAIFFLILIYSATISNGKIKTVKKERK